MPSDNQFLSDFISSAREKIAQMHELAIELEAEKSDLSIIDDLFRLIHTIKGEAALLGLNNLKILSHRIESLMGLARDRRIVVDRLFCDIFASGIGYVGQRIENIDEGSQNEDFSEVENKYLTALDEFIANVEENGSQTASSADTPSVCYQYFLGKADLTDDMAAVDTFLSKCESGSRVPADNAAFIAALDNLTEVFEKNGAADKCMIVQQMLADMEMMAEDDGGVDDFLLGMLKDNVDKVLDGIHKIELRKDAECEPIADIELEHAIELLEEQRQQQAAPEPEPVPEQKVQKKNEASYRIKHAQLNDIIKTVQLFDTVKDSFDVVRTRLAEKDDVDESVIFDFDEALDNLQLFAKVLFSMLLKTKVSSPKMLFQKVEKLVESLAHSLDKNVHVSMTGDDLKIDKSIIEIFEATLIHVVRNSVDHGIETPEERAAKGKPERGTVQVSLSVEDDRLLLTIADDGKGIDFAAIRMEAFKMAKITPVELGTMSDADTARLIFMPGLSTSVSISEVSGRGVGMNAVLDNIEKVGGMIDVKSQAGEGTTFIISLPVVSRDGNFYLKE